ncbi:uncharacterized protein TrAtP1_009778 [Trichoderma atroviride]|uniref:uncharacterized protein n=1 Tax=Hypocrea atroviridis TaxID=63577 RepID=UPI003321A1D3|nr:hypothetical protein TrAtP1_009778 [Trichoderma atroviride]
MGRWLVDAVGAPHHPQCRCWQVLVPSRRPTPPCALPLSSTAIYSSRIPFSSGLWRLLAFILLHPPTSYFYFIVSLLLPAPIPNPPAKGLLSPRSLRLVIRLVLPRPRSSTPCRVVSRNRSSQSPSARFATSTISPRKPCRHPNLIGTDATDSPTVDERKKGPPLPCQIPAAVRLSLFDSFVFGLP